MYIVSYSLKHSTYNVIKVHGDGDRDGGFDAMIIMVYTCISINYSISMSYALMFQLLNCNNCD